MAQIVSKSKTNHEILSSQTIYETVKGSHEYNIRGYSLAKGMGVVKYTSSRTFTVGGHDWVIRFYPNVGSKDNDEYICLYIDLLSPGEVKAMFEFKLLDQSEKGVHKIHTFEHKFNAPGYVGVFQFLCWPSYLKNDCLRIHYTVAVVQTRDEEGKRYVIYVPPSDMIQNLMGLLESEIGSDITFHVGDEFFRAHKSILAARSPVFRAQFFGLVGNPDMETAMLLFLYSDELPEPRELSDSDSLCTSTTLMQHLLAAADFYDLARLKLMCEAKLCDEITANTVATTMALAERHQCLKLKTVGLNFAAQPENLGGDSVVF
ncbi:hypothetical protein MKX01_022522 [Papaver californicum]|nr:hypothetical protein MKX01_022522 [Papaver californicum]